MGVVVLSPQRRSQSNYRKTYEQRNTLVAFANNQATRRRAQRNCLVISCFCEYATIPESAVINGPRPAGLWNGVWTDFEYDDADRLENVYNRKSGPTTISSFEYQLDAVGNRVEMVDGFGMNEYEYDPLHRLVGVTYPDPETDVYTYDANGNRLTRDSDDYTYDAADQLLDLEGLIFDYDDNGNQIEKGTDTFDYDHENRLVEAVTGGVTSTSVYNGDGTRVGLTVDAGTPVTTNYAWDVNRSLPVVMQDGTSTFVYGLDLISATDGGGAQTYFTYDGLGSPRISRTVPAQSQTPIHTTCLARFALAPAAPQTTGGSRANSTTRTAACITSAPAITTQRLGGS